MGQWSHFVLCAFLAGGWQAYYMWLTVKWRIRIVFHIVCYFLFVILHFGVVSFGLSTEYFFCLDRRNGQSSSIGLAWVVCIQLRHTYVILYVDLELINGLWLFLRFLRFLGRNFSMVQNGSGTEFLQYFLALRFFSSECIWWLVPILYFSVQ